MTSTGPRPAKDAGDQNGRARLHAVVPTRRRGELVHVSVLARDAQARLRLLAALRERGIDIAAPEHRSLADRIDAWGDARAALGSARASGPR